MFPSWNECICRVCFIHQSKDNHSFEIADENVSKCFDQLKEKYPNIFNMLK